LLLAGAAAIVVALVAGAAGGTASAGPGWKTATLLIAGCDLLVAASVVSAPRVTLARLDDTDLTALLSGAIADGVMLLALSAATIVTLFGNSKPAERLGYFLAILVLLPLCVVLAWRRQCSRRTVETQRVVASAILAATAGALLLARAVAPLTAGTVGSSLFLALELVMARTAIALWERLGPSTWAQGLPASAALAATPVLLGLSAVAFVPAASFSLLDIAIPLAAALATFCLLRLRRARAPSRAGVRVADAGFVLVASLVVFYVGRPSGPLASNQNYFLGPALDVLHGHPMLVSTFSQYGVGMIDALAAVFLVVPIGYGTFTILLAALTVLFFAVFYVVLRWSTRSVLVAALGLMTVVVLDIFGQVDFYAFFPSTGVLRFGLPWLVIACALAAVANPRHEQLFDGLLLAVVAVASVWSGEAAAYCLGTAIALACLSAATADASARERLRTGALRIALLIAVSASSVLAFTLVSRAATGVWPDWGGYLEYIHLYTIGDFGDLPIRSWSPGLAIGGVYLISAIAIVLLAMTRAELVRERIVAFRAATGLTALGTLVYTYFLGRSHPNNVVHVSPPAVALLFVWFDIVRCSLSSRQAVAIAGAAVVFFAALVLAGERRSIETKYSSTALAAVLGSSAPLGSQLAALSHNPVVEPATTRVVTFVKSLRRGYTSLTVLLGPFIETEVMLRLDTGNTITSSNPIQEAISRRSDSRIAAAVRSLPPDGVVVINETEHVLALQEYAFSLLQRRFTLRQIAAGGSGLRAFLLTEPG
jgi:hypothetical protein